jgi:hypothetical protein
MTSIKERTEISKSNPRNIKSILEEIQTLSTINEDVAFSCFYVIISDKKPIIGISVRLAELIASSWSNIHSGSRIISKNDKEVTVQGFVHDFEKNSIFTVEVQRSIFGMSSEQSIQSTNAASSIAFRNAIFKAIPASLVASIVDSIKSYVINQIDNGEDTLSRVYGILEYYKKRNISSNKISSLLGRTIQYDLDNIRLSSQELFLLMGIKNAIEEGDTTLNEVFNLPTKSKKPSRYSMSDYNSDSSSNKNTLGLKKVIKDIEEKSEKTYLELEDMEKRNIVKEEVKPKRKRGRPRKK